MPTMEKSWLM